MSLPDEQSEVTYVGNNSTVTAYPVTFRFFDATDLSVFVVETNGELTPLELTSGFTVSGGDGSTGNIQTVVAVSASKHVLIERNVPLTQPVGFTDLGKFPSSTVDRALDRATMQIQQVARDSARALSVIDGGNA